MSLSTAERRILEEINFQQHHYTSKLARKVGCLRREGLWGSGGVAPTILNLSSRFLF